MKWNTFLSRGGKPLNTSEVFAHGYLTEVCKKVEEKPFSASEPAGFSRAEVQG
jgi:hypothetical protein